MSSLGLAALVLATGCDAIQIVSEYSAPESGETLATPFPRLADTPPTPPRGESGPGVPPAATGDALLDDLGAEASVQAEISRRLAAPEVEVDPLLRDAARVRARREEEDAAPEG